MVTATMYMTSEKKEKNAEEHEMELEFWTPSETWSSSSTLSSFEIRLKEKKKEKKEKTTAEDERRCLFIKAGLVLLCVLLCLGAIGWIAHLWGPSFIVIMKPSTANDYFPITTRAPGVYTEWGVSPNSTCGVFRLVLYRIDCLPAIQRCEDRIAAFESGKLEHTEQEFFDIIKGCHQGASCARQFRCEQLDRLSEKVARRVSSFFMTKMEHFFNCFVDFVRAVRDDSFDNCTSHYDFLSRSYKIKNRAYIDGEECFVSFAQENCDEVVADFLENAYTEFVKLATIPSDECGVYEQLEAKECTQFVEWFYDASKRIDKEGNGSMTDYENLIAACDRLHDCTDTLYDDCALKDVISFTKKHCARMRAEVSPFMECFRRMKFGSFAPNSTCLNGTALDFHDPVNACKQISHPQSVCLKGVMEDYCGLAMSRDDFMEGRRHLWETWDCEHSYERKRKAGLFNIW